MGKHHYARLLVLAFAFLTISTALASGITPVPGDGAGNGAAADLAVGADTGPREYEYDGYIVAFSELPAVEVGDTYAGARVSRVLDGLNFLLLHPDDEDAFVAALEEDPAVRYFQKNRLNVVEFFSATE